MSMKFIPVGETKAHLQIGSGLPVEIDTAGNLKAAGKVQGQPATEAGDVVTFEQAFGVGQTRQVVTGSRAKLTTYTNLTGKCILASIYGEPPTSANPNSYVLIIRNGIQSGIARPRPDGLGSYFIDLIIFPGETYAYDWSADTRNVEIAEHR